jgi:hypothetical protein
MPINENEANTTGRVALRKILLSIILISPYLDFAFSMQSRAPGWEPDGENRAHDREAGVLCRRNSAFFIGQCCT